MDERKKDVREMTNEEYRSSSPDYGELIIEEVDNILCSQNRAQKEILYYICLGVLQKKR
ncbi:MAG: hypothetical protein K2N15_08925 [Lachnospiraceae bacterium]|nr:hypothetical protein [Lachnospiraceae bacterium]